jgi:hypothetical protein
MFLTLGTCDALELKCACYFKNINSILNLFQVSADR